MFISIRRTLAEHKGILMKLNNLMEIKLNEAFLLSAKKVTVNERQIFIYVTNGWTDWQANGKVFHSQYYMYEYVFWLSLRKVIQTKC